MATKPKKYSVADDGSFKEDPNGDIELDESGNKKEGSANQAQPEEEVKLQTTEEWGDHAPKKGGQVQGIEKPLPADHTYHDRLVAQAEGLGIEVKEGQTDEALIDRIRMGGSA